MVAFCLAGVVCINWFVPMNTRVPSSHLTWSYSAIAWLMAGIVLAASTNLGHRPLLSWKPIVELGKRSYGLYVFHVFGLALAKSLAPSAGPARWITIVLGGLLITVACAFVSYRVLERPFLLLKERYARVVSRPA